MTTSNAIPLPHIGGPNQKFWVSLWVEHGNDEAYVITETTKKGADSKVLSEARDAIRE